MTGLPMRRVSAELIAQFSGAIALVYAPRLDLKLLLTLEKHPKLVGTPPRALFRLSSPR